ncbi:hypothetical protein O0235_14615 [Tepidiforma flava]|uniref:Uncharacterized protein n=1 Tax=Tepidiforma flava TaxID=3004094 RepID=A0ABY7M644_9CHLR|nr:hypothetical protein [Tepidiforma flava]WBL35979.1 hypothetical protein O0235_14615 [Tepidiforma flava]
MRRLAPSIALAFALLLAVPAHPAGAAGPCIEADPAALEPAVLAANLIVVAEVREASPLPELAPEAFLKGTVTRQAIRFADVAAPPSCAPAALPRGARVLAFLSTEGGGARWPAASALFVLRDGTALRADGEVPPVAEADLLQRVRALTGQQAAPPSGAESGAGIDWSGTILPVGALLLAVFGIGLVLMRTWHRIDPS